MPDKKVGSTVYHFKGGKWSKKAKSKAKKGRLSAMKRHLASARG